MRAQHQRVVDLAGQAEHFDLSRSQRRLLGSERRFGHDYFFRVLPALLFAEQRLFSPPGVLKSCSEDGLDIQVGDNQVFLELFAPGEPVPFFVEH